jgi:hypothetical protein
MTDTPPIPPAKASDDTLNIVALGVGTVATLGGLVALHLTIPLAEVLSITSPIVSGCLVIIQRGTR